MGNDMAKIQEFIIRPYKEKDREAVRKICCDTAFMGQPVEIIFDDREIIADIFTLFYTDYEPESAFVAEFKEKVIGYLVGCKNIAEKERVFFRFVLPGILVLFIKRRFIFKKKTLRLVFHAIKSFLRGELKKPILKQYPADLHINVDKDFRRFGLGTKLMDAFFEYLRKNNVIGIHLTTYSEQGRKFFMKIGFTLVGEKTMSLWRYLLNRDIKISTFGKLLEKSKR